MSPDCLPKGFRFGAAACQIKPSGKPDIGIVIADGPSVAAGVYTQNKMLAAPVLLCQQRTPSNTVRAVVTNSGNANACTGRRGMEDANAIARQVAERLGCDPMQVLVMSTGIIGVPLPMGCVARGIDQALLSPQPGVDSFMAAAEGILTTDQATKTAGHTFCVGDQEYRVAGMAKGAGMIAPNMATMLATVMTDFPLSQDRAQAAIHRAAQHSFNCISVDGHASTNDTLLLLSSHPVETDGDPSVEESEILAAGFGEFEKVLTQVCEYLARRIVLDGEGAGRIFEINIGGATNDGDARAIADTVANSNLVKTAIHGCDPNWGRIMSAVGNAAADVELSRCSLKINDQLVFENGAPVSFDAVGVSDSMRNTDTVMLDIVVGDATGTSTVWASDLGIDYVTFNSEYTT